jgi:hypothetical protein
MFMREQAIRAPHFRKFLAAAGAMRVGPKAAMNAANSAEAGS